MTGSLNSACDGTAKGRNFFGGKVVSTHAEVDDLGPDSFYLLNKLRRHNWGEKDFVVANAMAESMRWTIKRFAAAKAELERRSAKSGAFGTEKAAAERQRTP